MTTPPTKSRGGAPEKATRNLRIARQWVSGETTKRELRTRFPWQDGPVSMAELARRHGISRERVRRILRRYCVEQRGRLVRRLRPTALPNEESP